MSHPDLATIMNELAIMEPSDKECLPMVITSVMTCLAEIEWLRDQVDNLSEINERRK